MLMTFFMARGSAFPWTRTCCMALSVATFTFFEIGTGVAGQRASCWRVRWWEKRTVRAVV